MVRRWNSIARHFRHWTLSDRIAESRPPHYPLLALEQLEARHLLSATLRIRPEDPNLSNDGLYAVPTTPINVSLQPGAKQTEMMLKVSPVNPLIIVAFSHRHVDALPSDQQRAIMDLFYARDGGATWSTASTCGSPGDPDIPDCPNPDGLPENRWRFDPALEFDSAGNLYIAYGVEDVGASQGGISLVVRKSNASTLESAQPLTFNSTQFVENDTDVDKFILATGPDGLGQGGTSVYIVYAFNEFNSEIRARGSSTAGALAFGNAVTVASGQLYGYPDIDVGPSGNVSVSWRRDQYLSLALDPDGLYHGQPFADFRSREACPQELSRRSRSS